MSRSNTSSKILSLYESGISFLAAINATENSLRFKLN